VTAKVRVRASTARREGTLLGGLDFFAVGSGPPLVHLRGFATTHTNPTGLDRYLQVRLLRPYARTFTVFSINRPAGLPAGATMADVAHQHADALAQHFATPVPVIGVSSGGSVALQLAADHPGLVSRLVLLASGCRLSDEGRAAQKAYLDAVEGHHRGAQHLVRLKTRSPLAGWSAAQLAWLLDPAFRPTNPDDMLRFGRSELDFDLTNRLADVTSPTLVLGGDSDRVYGPDILRATAEGVRNGRLVLYPHTSHGGALVHRGVARDVLAFLAEPHLDVDGND